MTQPEGAAGVGRRVRARALIGWLALTALTVPAVAEPRTDTGLVWQAPASCPDAAEVRARIERRLGRPPDAAVQGIEVEIAPDAGGFVAHIDLRGVTVENEIRVLTSARCDALTDAVAVVIARIAAERRPPESAPQPQARIELRAPAVAAPRTWGGGLRAMGVSGIGALPGIGVGGELAGYAWRRAMFVELSATRWMRSSGFLADGAPGRVDVRLDVATLRVGWRSQRLPLRGWLGGELGQVLGQGVALDDAQIGHGRWIAIDGGFGVAWAITEHARLVGTIELGIPLASAQFLLQDGGLVYSPERVTARSGIGLEVGW
jgi:hypothetical protein